MSVENHFLQHFLIKLPIESILNQICDSTYFGQANQTINWLGFIFEKHPKDSITSFHRILIKNSPLLSISTNNCRCSDHELAI
jgi:hypothetical protein